MTITVRDLMTVGVRTIRPETPLKDVARLFVICGISGAPVVEDGKVRGMITRSDILPHDGNGVARVAADAMTRGVVMLRESMTVAEAARVLHAAQVRRAPVVREGAVVGMITESDLLRPYLRTDDELLAEVESDVLLGSMDLSPRKVTVEVHDGVVSLEGRVADERQRSVLRRLTAAVPGVIGVTDRLWIEAAG